MFDSIPTVAYKGLKKNNLKESSLKILKQKYEKLNCWGLLASVDLYDCNPKYIRQPKKIKELIIGLCSAIKMKRYGGLLIKKFGQGSLLGYSAMQFIETSSITIHFDEPENRAFIDIFSCKFFDPFAAAEFCKKFLEAKKSKLRYHLRY